MSTAAAVLVLLSALTHVVVHVFIKRASNQLLFTWALWFWGCVVFLPIPLLWAHELSAASMGAILASGIASVVYFVSMGRAYEFGDLSVAYPICRGSAPVLVLLWSVVFLHERPNPTGLVGILLIAVGLVVVNLPRLGSVIEAVRSLLHPSAKWAALAGLCTSAATVIDKVGVGGVHPAFYTYLVMLLTLLGMTCVIRRTHGWRDLYASALRSPQQSVLVTAFAVGTNVLLLWAMRLGAPASYVGATREVGVIFAALAGVYVLGETAGILRITGSIVVTLGAAAIAMFG